MNEVPTSQEFNPEVYKKDWRWQEGDLTVTRTTQWSGPGCHDGCGVLLYQDKHGKVVKIEGDPNNPFNGGALCMRCLDLLEALYHPDRLKWPLKRAGERGENKWERITWDEAYDLIVDKVRYYQKNFGNQSITAHIGTGRNIWWQVPFFAYAGLQTPNMTGGYLSGDSCYSPRASQMALMNGDFLIADLSQCLPERFDDPAYTLPEVILIWGCNPIISNADGFFGHWIVEAMRRGTKLIVVDPRLTWLASKADIWLPVRPGTDAALVIAMLRVIIDEGLYDHDFVDKWCYGFKPLTERVREYDIDKVAEITWVPKEKIIAAARMFAAAHPANVHWGLPIDTNVSGIPLAQGVNALWAITGNTDIPGGMIMLRNSFQMDLSTDTGYRAHVPEEFWDKRYGVSKYPMRAFGVIGMAHCDEVLLGLERGEVKMSWYQSTNTFVNMATEAPRVYDAMKKAEFNVVVDLFMTPTAVAVADLVLPCGMSPERDGVRVWWQPMRAITKVMEYEECKADEQIQLDLIKRLNPSAAPGDTVREWMDNFLKERSTADFTFQELVEKVVVHDPFVYKKYEKGLNRPDGQPGFNTATGKIELLITPLDAWGHDPLPYYEEPRESPYSTPELYKEYPFVLTTGSRSFEFFHSEHRQLPTMREFHPDPMCEIHPDAAKRLGIIDGDWVWLENQRGRCKQKVRLNKTMDSRIVHAEHGWWFPERKAAEPDLFGAFDSNINNLTIQNDVGPTGFGAPYKNLLCKVYKVLPENDVVQPTTQVTRMGGFGYVKR